MADDAGVGHVIARTGSRILRLDRQWEKFVTACTIFQNVHFKFEGMLRLDECAAYCDYYVFVKDVGEFTILPFDYGGFFG